MNIYYSILGINDNASIETIKSQYRKLCKLYHPDLTNIDSIGKMALINEAYNVIKNKIINRTNGEDNTSSNYTDVNITRHKNSEYVYYKKSIEYFKKADINMAFRDTNAWDITSKSFDFNKSIIDFKKNIYKSLYYFNIVCINHENCEWFCDSINKISVINKKLDMIKIWEQDHKLL